MRDALPTDNGAIASLLGELGYPSVTDEVTERLKALEGVDYSVQVAERGGRVVGLLSLHRIHMLHISAPTCYLTALVTAADARRSGVGKELLQAAESWARAHDCGRLVLTTANHRHDAHDFYRANGFAQTGLRLVKNLA